MKKAITYGDLKLLRKKHEPVSEKMFLMLADVNEFDHRKKLVKKYGGYSDVQFYSDGTVTINENMVT